MKRNHFKNFPYMRGGVRRRPLSSDFGKHAHFLAQEIVSKHQHLLDIHPVGPVRVLKVGIEAVGGFIYSFTFRVTGDHGISVAYNARIWQKPAGMGYVIKSVEKVVGSEEEPIMGEEQLDLCEELSKLPLMSSVMSQCNDEGSAELACGKDSTKLAKQDSPAVKPARLTKLGVQPAKGVRFYMNFRVKGEDGLYTTYTAVVLVYAVRMGTRLESLEKVVVSGNLKKRKKLVALYKLPGAPMMGIHHRNDKLMNELVHGLDSGELHRLAFQLLLEEIRRERRSLKLNMARKAASFRWRNLMEHKKRSLIMDAAVMLKEKQSLCDP